MDGHVEKATAKYLEGYNCAQSVLYAFCDDLKLDPEMALKLACGFGAGMGRKQEVCGAVSGGIAVLGMKYGRGARDDGSATEATYVKTRELMDRFQERHGSYICRQLLYNCDLRTEQGQKYFRENDLRNKTCTLCVQFVVNILEHIMK
jgi:C_GCAxxG_C_C family probable redox protein